MSSVHSSNFNILLISGYLRKLSSIYLNLLPYTCVCYKYYFTFLPTFSCYNSANTTISLNETSGHITTSRAANVNNNRNIRDHACAYLISNDAWNVSDFNHRNNMHYDYIYTLEIKSLHNICNFGIGVASDTYNEITKQRNFRNIKYGISVSCHLRKPDVYQLNLSWKYWQHRYWESMNSKINITATNKYEHKLQLVLNCRESKLYLYYNSNKIKSIKIKHNVKYYPAISIYNASNYQIISCCNDIKETVTCFPFNQYILDEYETAWNPPFRRNNIANKYKLLNEYDSSMHSITNHWILIRLLWKGYNFINLASYDNKVNNLFNTLPKSKEISAADKQFWIIIEVYQYFRHYIYMDLLYNTMSNINDFYDDNNSDFIYYITSIITDFTLQNIDSGYNEYFLKENNLRYFVQDYVSNVHTPSKPLRSWMDKYVIPYMPSQYLIVTKYDFHCYFYEKWSGNYLSDNFFAYNFIRTNKVVHYLTNKTVDNVSDYIENVPFYPKDIGRLYKAEDDQECIDEDFINDLIETENREDLQRKYVNTFMNKNTKRHKKKLNKCLIKMLKQQQQYDY